jgi:hypothetical protein
VQQEQDVISGNERASSAGRAPGPGCADTRPAILVTLASAVGAVAILTAAAGCASQSSVSYRAVCENSRTHVRVADQHCAASPSASPGSLPGLMAHGGAQSERSFEWRYYRSGETAPAIGSKCSGGTTTPPERGGNVARGGAPPDGGVVSGDDGSGGGGGAGDSGGSGAGR